MHDKIFEGQVWSKGSGALVIGYAEEIGLDTEVFTSYNSAEMNQIVMEQRKEGVGWVLMRPQHSL